MFGEAFSFSSITASSKFGSPEPAELDMLARRVNLPNGELEIGEPERPKVVIDMLRRLVWALAVELGAAGEPVVAPLLPDLPKSSEKVAPAKEDRRRAELGDGGVAGGVVESDIVNKGNGLLVEVNRGTLG